MSINLWQEELKEDFFVGWISRYVIMGLVFVAYNDFFFIKNTLISHLTK